MCTDDDGIAGFIGLDGSYIAGIFVRAEKQSRGAGRQLLDHAKCIRPALTLHVYEQNARAVRFYRAAGSLEDACAVHGLNVDEVFASIQEYLNSKKA